MCLWLLSLQITKGVGKVKSVAFGYFVLFALKILSEVGGPAFLAEWLPYLLLVRKSQKLLEAALVTASLSKTKCRGIGLS